MTEHTCTDFHEASHHRRLFSFRSTTNFCALIWAYPLCHPPASTTRDESRDMSSCLWQINTCQWYLRPRQKLKSNSWHQKRKPRAQQICQGNHQCPLRRGGILPGLPLALGLPFYIQNVRCRLWLWSLPLRDSCASLSISEVPFVFCFVEMCTKLYNEDEFQPFDPTQEPVFPPELIVRYFTFVVL